MTDHRDLLLNVCLLFSKIMVENNQDKHQLRQSITAISKRANVKDVSCYNTQTAIFIFIKSSQQIRMADIDSFSNNFEKLTRATTAAKDYLDDKSTLEQFYTGLQKIDSATYTFPIWLQVFSAGIVGMSMSVLFSQNLNNVPMTFLISACGYFVFVLSFNALINKIFATFLAASCLSILTVCYLKVTHSLDVSLLLLSSIMPLLPGSEFVNGIKDIFSGDYLSGVTQLTEASMLIFVIVFPITLFFSL